MCCSLCALNPSKVCSACVLDRHNSIVDYFQGNAKITGIDFSSAKVDVDSFEFHIGSIKSSMSLLQVMTGYIMGLTAEDVPGTNDFVPFGENTPEPVR